jgi:hypothetical protein
MSKLEELRALRVATSPQVQDSAVAAGIEHEEQLEKRKQADLLVDLAHSSKIELWNIPGGAEGYATIPVDGHREN